MTRRTLTVPPTIVIWIGGAVAILGLVSLVLGLTRREPTLPAQQPPKPHTAAVAQFQTAPGGVWALEDSRLIFRDESWTPVRQWEGVKVLAFAPDGSAAAYADAGGTVRLVRPDREDVVLLPAASGQEIRALRWGTFLAAQVEFRTDHAYCVFLGLAPGEQPETVAPCDAMEIVDFFPADELLISIRDVDRDLHHLISLPDLATPAYYATAAQPIRILDLRNGTLLIGTGEPMQLAMMAPVPGAPLTHLGIEADHARLAPGGIFRVLGGRASFWIGESGESVYLGDADDVQVSPDGAALWLLSQGALRQVPLNR